MTQEKFQIQIQLALPDTVVGSDVPVSHWASINATATNEQKPEIDKQVQYQKLSLDSRRSASVLGL